MFAKLHRDCSVFNARREMIKRSDLGYGEYRVLLCVKGLYIGKNNENGVTASLHIIIFQIQYREVNVACLFESSAGMVVHSTPPTTPSTVPPPPPQAPTEQPSTTNKKNARNKAKPGLARQNGNPVVEAQQQVPTEALPQDFFIDLHG